ncbi:MAG: lipid-A-disaccharide synthase [Bacteroidales bacterium]|nr:lipid-A-disaccharide synthase [Bacteroidales bacterium]
MRYYIIAGEASGDLHGANLMRALREKDPQAEFRFWGGDAMAAVGGTPVRHIRDLAIMGFVEVVAHLGTVLGNISFCKHDILEYHPDVVIGVDYPGFNLKIEAWAHKQGFRTVHYISPNLWAWKKGRINGMRRSLDLLCCILPFEQRFFAENDFPQAIYVGHPLLDAISAEGAIADNGRPIVALLPGSRRQELRESLPKMVELARLRPQYRYVVAGMSLLGKELYTKLIPADSNIEVVYDQTYPLLASAYAAVVCSGTATLETALFNVPQVVCYSGNPLSYLIARAVVGRRIKYISLVNLIADSPVVTELIQGDFNPDRLEFELYRITKDNIKRQRMLKEYAAMRALLGNGGASNRTAQAIIDLIK